MKIGAAKRRSSSATLSRSPKNRLRGLRPSRTRRVRAIGLPSYGPRWGKRFVYDGAASDRRYPGQYFDAETGLHQNYFRDYDPKTGRYVQADPIGLEGGINVFIYVEGNPLNFFDPDGLEPRGERGGTGGSAGQNTNNPRKKCRELTPPDPRFVECKHHQTGKWIRHPRPTDMPFPSPKKSEMCDDRSALDKARDAWYNFNDWMQEHTPQPDKKPSPFTFPLPGRIPLPIP